MLLFYFWIARLGGQMASFRQTHVKISNFRPQVMKQYTIYERNEKA